MNDKTFARVTAVIFLVAFFMPQIATYIGMAIHGDRNSTDAGVAPLLIGVYNLPFMIGSSIALFVGRSFNKRANYQSAKTAFTVSLVISFVSLAMIIPWGLLQ